MQQPSGLSFTEVQGALHVRCLLPTPRPPLEPASLRTLMAGSGFADWPLCAQAVADLLARWNGDEGSFEITLPRSEDASLAVEVDKDALHAWASFRPAVGGRPLDLDAVLQALAAAGVVHGVDEAALRAACSQDQTLRVQAAAATLPVAGEDTRFELLAADTRDRSPKVDEFGHIDFHQLGDIPLVRAGQPLMRRHPATPGVAGVDVRGQPIAAKPGKSLPFDERLVGAGVDPGDAGLLVALVNGQPVNLGSAVMVEQVLRLKNVSMASGNIDFDGTVEVAEDVQPGMKLHASGDVIVKGTVEAAQISCEGDVQVGGGIIAHAVVKAGRAVAARFAENASIQAQTVVTITDMAVHCTLEAGNEIVVGSPSARRSRLVGGWARAMMRVQACTLGASAGGVTRVQVGVNPELDRRLAELQAQAQRQKAEEEKLSKVVKHLGQHGDARGLLPQVQATWKKLLADWGQSLAEIAEVEAKLALTASARVDVFSGVEGDVELHFGKLQRPVRRSFGAGSFGLGADGRLAFTDEAGVVTALS